MSRYQPSYDSGESRRSPRDQSPSRYNDRDEFRGGSARGVEKGRSIPDARAANHNAFQSNRDTFREPTGRDSSRDFPPREPPRGPRNLIEPPTGPRAASHGSDYRVDFGFRGDFRGDRGRGRARGWRDDSRDRGRDADRDYRDRRDERGPPPSFREDRGRERWGRDTSYRGGRRPSSPQGRARSPPYGPRDNRDAPPSIELERARRGSRDGPLSGGSPLGESPQPYARGYGRGRGGRGRGRGGYYEDFHRTPGRSRSPDPSWGRRTQPSATPPPQVPAFGSTSSNPPISSAASIIPGPHPSSSAQDVSVGPVPGVAVPTAPRSHVSKGQIPQSRPHISSAKWINPSIKAPPHGPSSHRSGASDAPYRRSYSPLSKSTHSPESVPTQGNENHTASEFSKNEDREILEKPDSVSPTSADAPISAQEPPRKRRPILGKRPPRVKVPALRDIPDNASESDSADDFDDNYFENEIAKTMAEIAKLSEENPLRLQPEPPAVFLTPFIERDLDDIITFSESLAVEEECVAPKLVEKAIPGPPEPAASLAPKPRTKGKSRSVTPRPVEAETTAKPGIVNGAVAALELAQVPESPLKEPGAADILQPSLSTSIEQDTDGPQPNGEPKASPTPATNGRVRKPAPKMETFDEFEGYQTEAEYAEALEAVRRQMITPPMDGLPNFKCKLWYQDQEFLKTLEPKPEVEALIRQKLEESSARRQREQEQERQRWRERYLEYRRWTDFSDDPVAVKSRDKFAKSRAKAAAEAAAPHPSTLPSAGAKPEGQRRMGRFATEHDFERVLRESEQEAKETKEREERVARARTASAKEATIPDMAWDEEEWMEKQFIDTTHIVPFERSFAVLEFGEPVDNFTEEEQQIFEQVYLEYPKQWGKIAEALERRDYKACIQHYYLVKHESNLKEKLKKQPKKRKGRKANKGLGNPKSNALMADLGNRDETEDGQEAENGGERRRPRRAAAPTWPFEAPASESEVASPAPTPSRKSNATPKGDESAPPTKKKTKVPREKGTKQSKNSQLLAAAVPIAAANRQADSPVIPPAPADWKNRRGSAGSVRYPPQYDGTNNTPQPFFAPPSVPVERPNPSIPVNFETIPSQPFQHHERVDSTPPVPFGEQQDRRNIPQTSSYWSVPESTEFPALLRHFGTDWHGIAKHMTTKTHIMVYTTIFQQWLAVPLDSNKSRCVANIQTQVKNYYQRQVDSGKMKAWEDIAKEADEKKERGESTGSPPQPTILAKRRYDGTQGSVPRAGSTMDGLDDLPSSGQSTVLPQNSPPQPPSLQSTRFPPLLQAATAPQIQPATPTAVLAKHLPPQPIQQAPQQVQPQQRPPRGFFTTESPRPIQANVASQRSRIVAQTAELERQQALKLEQQQQQQAQQQARQQAQQERHFLKQENDMPNLHQFEQYTASPMHPGTTLHSRPEAPKSTLPVAPPETRRTAPPPQQFPPRSQQAVHNLLTDNPGAAREIRSSPSPAAPRPPMSAPSVSQEPYSATPPQQQPGPIPAARPQETGRKSNIMSLLNDDEPLNEPPRPIPSKRVSDISVSSLHQSRTPPPQHAFSRYSQPSSQPPQQISQQMASQQPSQQQLPPQHTYAPPNQHSLHQHSSSIGQPRSYTPNSFETRPYAPPPLQQQQQQHQQMYSQPPRQSMITQAPQIRREPSLGDMHGMAGGYAPRTSAPSQPPMRLKESPYSSNPTPPPAQPIRQPAGSPVDRAPPSDRDFYPRQQAPQYLMQQQPNTTSSPQLGPQYHTQPQQQQQSHRQLAFNQTSHIASPPTQYLHRSRGNSFDGRDGRYPMATTATPVQQGYSQAPLHQGGPGPLSMQYPQPHSAQERYEGSYERDRERQLIQERGRMQEEEVYRRQVEERRRLDEASRR